MTNQKATPSKKGFKKNRISPLKYAGGKTRAIPYILGLTETVEKRVVSPFCGGSSAELAITSEHGLKVQCYDAHKPLITFFQCVSANPTSLVTRATNHYDTVSALSGANKRGYYSELKASLDTANDNECAAAYFAANRLSFGGSLHGGMAKSQSRFTSSSLAYLARFGEAIKDLDISWQLGDFRKTIPENSSDFLFLDPPYHLEKGRNNLYGVNGEMHNGFDHHALADLLKKHDYWLLCYNDCPLVRDLYQGYCILMPTWAYGMTKKPSSEVFILSRRLERELRESQNATFLKLLETAQAPTAANDNDPAPPPETPKAMQIAKPAPAEKQRLVLKSDGLFLKIRSRKGKPRLVRAALDGNGNPIVKNGKVLSVFAEYGSRKGAARRAAISSAPGVAPSMVAVKPTIRLKAINGVLVPHIERLLNRKKALLPIVDYDGCLRKFVVQKCNGDPLLTGKVA